MTEEPTLELLSATQQLAGRVDQLGRSLQLAEKQGRRNKLLMVIVTVLSIISLMGVVVIVSLFQQIHEAVDTNQESLVINCQNANESRKANTTLWSFVIDQSLTQAKTDQERKNLESYRTWILALYQQHDCSDLSRKYPVPPPPVIVAT